MGSATPKPHWIQERMQALADAPGRTEWAELAGPFIMQLVEQVQSLELACDHHKMFWQKAEERERGLKEQLESVQHQEDLAKEVIEGMKEQYGTLERAASELEAYLTAYLSHDHRDPYLTLRGLLRALREALPSNPVSEPQR